MPAMFLKLKTRNSPSHRSSHRTDWWWQDGVLRV